jgi:hypothetical protein
MTRHLYARVFKAYKEMVAKGWCYHQFNHLLRTYKAGTFLRLARLVNIPFRKANHSRCAEHSACIAHNADLNNYETRHTTAECNCAMVLTPYMDLVRTLRNDNIPLLRIEETRENPHELQLRVLTRTSTSEYLAVSHVWADGLGNPGMNGLPTCQLRRLRASMTSLWALLKFSNVCECQASQVIKASQL